MEKIKDQEEEEIKKGPSPSGRLKRLNNMFLEEEEKQETAKDNLIVSITDKTGRKTDVSIPEEAFTVAKYAGENNNIDPESLGQAIDILDDALTQIENQIGKDLMEDERANPQVVTLMNVFEKAKETYYLSFAVEYQGGHNFRLRDQFKEEFNWKEVGSGILDVLSLELGEQVSLNEEELAKVLEHKNEVFLDMEALGFEFKGNEEALNNIKVREAGSHSEISQAAKEVAIERANQMKSSRGFVKKADSVAIQNTWNNVMNSIPEATIEKYGEDTVKEILETVKDVYQTAYLNKRGD